MDPALLDARTRRMISEPRQFWSTVTDPFTVHARRCPKLRGVAARGVTSTWLDAAPSVCHACLGGSPSAHLAAFLHCEPEVPGAPTYTHPGPQEFELAGRRARDVVASWRELAPWGDLVPEGIELRKKRHARRVAARGREMLELHAAALVVWGDDRCRNDSFCKLVLQGSRGPRIASEVAAMNVFSLDLEGSERRTVEQLRGELLEVHAARTSIGGRVVFFGGRARAWMTCCPSALTDALEHYWRDQVLVAPAVLEPLLEVSSEARSQGFVFGAGHAQKLTLPPGTPPEVEETLLTLVSDGVEPTEALAMANALAN